MIRAATFALARHPFLALATVLLAFFTTSDDYRRSQFWNEWRSGNAGD